MSEVGGTPHRVVGPVGRTGGTPHRVVNPPELGPAVGFANAVVAAPGRLLFLGGQIGSRPDGSLAGPGMVEQFDQAAANVATALGAAGGAPEQLVWMQVMVTDAGAYLGSLKEIGAAWRARLGRHFPAMAWFEVKSLFEPDALIELMAIAVVPRL